MGSASGSISVPVVKADASRTREREDATSYVDNSYARFGCLLKLAHEDVELAGWVDVVDPSALDGIGIGALIEVECDVYVPDSIKMLSSSSEVVPMLDLLDTLRPLAPMFGGDDGADLPDPAEVAGVRSLVGALKSDQVLVGELENSAWRVVGQLKFDHLRSEIDGVARVVGKVSRSWKQGEWKPLLALPGMSLLPCDQRRRMQQSRPKPGDEQNYLEGPRSDVGSSRGVSLIA